MDPFDDYTAVGVIAVLQIEYLEDVAPLTAALAAGGIRTIELTLRTPVSLDALKEMQQEQPDLAIGAGTVLNPAQADAAQRAGAAFAVAPGLDIATVHHCREIGLPFVPGVATPSEIQSALELGCRYLKFFPAEYQGGVRGLRTASAPFAHLSPRYIPLGGITASTAPAYLAEPCVAAVGGSWIAPLELVRRKDWARIHENAIEAVQLAAARPAFS